MLKGKNIKPRIFIYIKVSVYLSGFIFETTLQVIFQKKREINPQESFMPYVEINVSKQPSKDSVI